LLPNVFGAPVYGRAHRIVNRCRGAFLNIRHQVAVDIHRDRDRRVPEPLLDDFGIRLRRPQACRSTPSARTRRYAPPVRMLKLTEAREITPYKWAHPDEER